MLIVSDRLLPDRGQGDGDLLGGLSRDGYLTDVLIPEQSELIGQSLHNSRLQRRFDVDVLELHRGQDSFSAPWPTCPCRPATGCCCAATATTCCVSSRSTPSPSPRSVIRKRTCASWPARPPPPAGGGGAAAQRFHPGRGERAGHALSPALQRHPAGGAAGNQVLRELLGRVVLQAGDVLLLQAPVDAIRGLQANNDLVLLDELEKDLPTTDRKLVAMGITALMILLPMLKILPLMASVLLAMVAMVATGCLRSGELLRSVRWDVILLLGSLSCFSVAMQKTGLAEALATDLLQSLQGWPAYGVLLVVFVLGQLFTEALSNGTTVVLLIPIATELAKGLALPPMAFIFAITFAASQSFLTPIGYQTNLMVFGPGRYRFLDMARYGAPCPSVWPWWCRG